MFGTETTSRTTLRMLSVAIAITLALLLVACGSSTPTGGAQVPSTTQPSPAGSPGSVYAQRILVTREDGRLDWITVFIVRKPDGDLAIVDSDGQDYEDLDDFRANNNLLSEDDKITLPRNFPSITPSEKLELMTVSGHTGTSRVWWLTGGIVLVLIIAGSGFLWLRAHRRNARDPAYDVDPQEPLP